MARIIGFENRNQDEDIIEELEQDSVIEEPEAADTPDETPPEPVVFTPRTGNRIFGGRIASMAAEAEEEEDIPEPDVEPEPEVEEVRKTSDGFVMPTYEQLMDIHKAISEDKRFDPNRPDSDFPSEFPGGRADISGVEFDGTPAGFKAAMKEIDDILMAHYAAGGLDRDGQLFGIEAKEASPFVSTPILQKLGKALVDSNQCQIMRHDGKPLRAVDYIVGQVGFNTIVNRHRDGLEPVFNIQPNTGMECIDLLDKYLIEWDNFARFYASSKDRGSVNLFVTGAPQYSCRNVEAMRLVAHIQRVFEDFLPTGHKKVKKALEDIAAIQRDITNNTYRPTNDRICLEAFHEELANQRAKYPSGYFFNQDLLNANYTKALLAHQGDAEQIQFIQSKYKAILEGRKEWMGLTEKEKFPTPFCQTHKNLMKIQDFQFKDDSPICYSSTGPVPRSSLNAAPPIVENVAAKKQEATATDAPAPEASTSDDMTKEQEEELRKNGERLLKQQQEAERLLKQKQAQQQRGGYGYGRPSSGDNLAGAIDAVMSAPGIAAGKAARFASHMGKKFSQGRSEKREMMIGNLKNALDNQMNSSVENLSDYIATSNKIARDSRNDPDIQKHTNYIRDYAKNNNMSYEDAMGFLSQTNHQSVQGLRDAVAKAGLIPELNKLGELHTNQERINKEIEKTTQSLTKNNVDVADKAHALANKQQELLNNLEDNDLTKKEEFVKMMRETIEKIMEMVRKLLANFGLGR